ncbi:Plasma membrane sulfite pump involved in sulfite metabolism [Coemansia sp. RSA 2611]|nr:Plasma membrane sulfite pump involved in sulfite metabolism [Coemansia sp. RSA 2611]
MGVRDIWRIICDSFLRDLETWRHIVEWFMPSWFTVCMGSGILATCIARLPYETPALRVFGLCIFFFNTALLCAFLGLQLAQLLVYPRILAFMRQHPRRMLHYGAIPMSLATVVSGACAFWPSGQLGEFVLVVWALWWVSVVLAAAASLLLLCLIVSRQTHSIEGVTGAWLLLVAPLAVCATAAGAIAEQLPPTAALLTTLIGYCLLGAGAPLTCCIVVLYVLRITTYKLPAPDAIITAFIPLGPIGQIGAAALSLGAVAARVELPALLADLLLCAGILAALLAWGSCVFWLAHAVLAVVYQRRSARIPFNMSWWALTFPVGVFAALTAGLADALELGYLQVNFLVLVALLLVLWLFNIARTVAGAWTGSIFGVSSPDITLAKPPADQNV